ncbi:MAG: bifunctional phosphopantothenoylcysteine decarboxylase/phosphopantothenate--cysteine ligase CoaBC [Deltaproteobacteria bacterium HGW-Deltaproteobacteria-19]|jgi:phosphopantothenoylcysteine decarboxylase/phosphopantothenate--cysteine ligase|nr:MAG: bifunctional phosphopantothenoylcysteine decarboxylase/phosphopantothenate--cysteine ligase CoaBC [Deltaproteobacteria bacterium HGW-Deltaproteobacteria-19]
MLKGRHVVLGVTGGIAAYKCAELTRELIRRGAEVKVIMTESAREFMTPLTLQTLSGNPVYTELFTLIREQDIAHIALAEFAELMIVAPATANVIGKAAAGIADDLLTTVLMAMKAPVLFCPAMNTQMYGNPALQENLKKLQAWGYHVLPPASGPLACKAEGQGRLPEVTAIVEAAVSVLTLKDLAGEHVLVTAGPTREPFDPVRFITNYSSGKMGYAVALQAQRRGARVTLVSGPTSLPPPDGVEIVNVGSALEMRDAVLSRLAGVTVVIKAAAVADYRPAALREQKIKKKGGSLTLELERNPDIIQEIGRKEGRRIIVGFAMESENLLENARSKMVEKNMDLIVANDLREEGAGFQCDTNVIKILDRKGNIEELPLMDKAEAAGRILDRVRALLKEKKRGRRG